MKRFISIALLLVLCLSLFAGCSKEEPKDNTAGLQQAKKFLDASYMNDPVETASDFTLVGIVVIDGVTYNVDWTTDCADIVITRNDKLVNFDVPASGAEVVKYVLTATLSDANGNKLTSTFNRQIPSSASAGKTMEDIVEDAYKLENGAVMDGVATLKGKITAIKTPYDPGYKNITVIIQVGNLTNKRIECYRLKGEGAENLAIGDTITVTGVLKNYNGTIEFDAGCTLDAVEKGQAVTAPTTTKEILDAAFALGDGDSLPYSATMTGVITEIKTPYDPGYGNLSVMIQVEDKTFQCYRLKGEGADKLAVGDTITVTGTLTNYKGNVQFAQGCTLDKVVPGGGTVVVAPTDQKEIVDAAYALEAGAALPYTATLTGKITEIKTPYNEQYGNITVIIVVEGKEDKPIICFRMKGEGAGELAVNDVISVTGMIKNYVNAQGVSEIEFDASCTFTK